MVSVSDWHGDGLGTNGAALGFTAPAVAGLRAVTGEKAEGGTCSNAIRKRRAA